jgi:hypothetical protein
MGLFFISSAWATDNEGIPPGPGDCDATMTYDQCQAFLAAGGIGGTGTGSGGWWCFWCSPTPPKQDCSKLSNTTCRECKTACDCGYNNAVADCEGQTCKDNAFTDREGCYGNCYNDYLDVC